MEMLVGPTRAAHSALAWVCTTAFGCDVVPDVNRIPTGAIGSGVRTGASSGDPTSESNGANRSSPEPGASPVSSPATAIQDRSGPAAATRGANDAWVTAATQPVFAMKNSSSAWTDRVLVVTPTAPTTAHAYQASTISGQLSAWRSTRSPWRTPRAARPAAMLRTSCQNSA